MSFSVTLCTFWSLGCLSGLGVSSQMLSFSRDKCESSNCGSKLHFNGCVFALFVFVRSLKDMSSDARDFSCA